MSSGILLSALFKKLTDVRCVGFVFLALAYVIPSAAFSQDIKMEVCHVRADMYQTAMQLKIAMISKRDAAKIALERYKDLPKNVRKSSSLAIDQVYQFGRTMDPKIFYDSIFKNCVETM
jgi:hypothetical protein